MTDVALDDLIKQDKQKNKTKPRINRDNTRGGRGGGRRGGDRQRGNIRKNSDSRNDRDNKTRIIRKGGNRDRNDRNDRNDRGRNDRFRGRDRKDRDFDDRRRERPERNENKEADQAQQKGRTLKVMGLHPDFTNEDLYKLFATEGALQKCLIQQDNFGRSMTTAIVKYHNAQSAKSAIQNLNQHKVMNSILTVEPYKNKRP